MARVGYEADPTITATAISCAVGCVISAFVCNTPFIVAPPTSVSIFLAVSLQQRGMSSRYGNAAVLASGLGLAIIGAFPFIARFVTKLIPDSIQAATAVGIGLITALAGATEIHLVIPGQYTLLDMGDLTIEVIFAIGALVLVAVLLHYHVKGAFCAGLFCGTLAWWIVSGEWPESIASMPTFKVDNDVVSNLKLFAPVNGNEDIMLILNLIFLYILTLNGLARGLSDLSGLTKPNGAIPRGNFLLIVCGLTTMLSGYFTGPPILLSPESAAGIKAGAKTGLSTLVCGIMFALSSLFGPLFASIPAAGTAPLLLMVGVVLFKNTERINWAEYKYAVPAYCVLVFIPFTYSILRGVAFGYIMYVLISFYTGDYIINIQNLYRFYTTVATNVATKVSNVKNINILEIHKHITLEKIMEHMDEQVDNDENIFGSESKFKLDEGVKESARKGSLFLESAPKIQSFDSTIAGTSRRASTHNSSGSTGECPPSPSQQLVDNSLNETTFSSDNV
jgi:AGZA family xanthine/uracil permease-like MFS transporter